MLNSTTSRQSLQSVHQERIEKGTNADESANRAADFEIDDLSLHALKSTKWGAAPHYRSYDDVQALFDRWANGPDVGVDGSVDYETDVAKHYPAPKVVADALIPLLSPGARILDVGCGTGVSGHPFITAGMHVVGVDLSANMMEKALAKGYESIHQRDISKDDIGECLGKFDALVSVGVFGEWVSAERRLDALLPALKSSCRLGITMETEHSDLDAVSSILKSHGFSILMSARGPGWHDPQYPPEDYFFVIASRD